MRGCCPPCGGECSEMEQVVWVYAWPDSPPGECGLFQGFSNRELTLPARRPTAGLRPRLATPPSLHALPELKLGARRVRKHRVKRPCACTLNTYPAEAGSWPKRAARQEPCAPRVGFFKGVLNDFVGFLFGDVDAQADDLGSGDASGAEHVYSNGILGGINHLLELLSELEELVGGDGSFEDAFLDMGEESPEGVHDAVSSSVADDVVADDDVGHGGVPFCQFQVKGW